MIKFILSTFSLLTLLIFQINAQVITDKTFHDFGEVNSTDDKYVDFKLTNASENLIKITKFETPYGVSIRFSERNIEADQSVLVRIKYTPKRKGEFKADVPIYVSSNDQPIVLTIQGKAITVNVDESLDVPYFESEHSENAELTFGLDIKVMKMADDSPVKNAKMDIIWNGVLYKTMYTDEKGLIRNAFVPDNYYIVVHAENLGLFESELSIHKNIKEFNIKLGPEGTISQVTSDSSEIYETEITEYEDSLKIPDTLVVSEENVENSSFSDKEYRSNNIVFLIDVSISMKEKGKLSLLQASLIELTNLLRSTDKVAIVTYSSKAEIVLKSTNAGNKEAIKEIIQNLEPKGSTAGAKGIKKAYQVLSANKIENGNNQIFITTDGAFNLENRDKGLIEMAEKNAANGYKLSVVGIKNDLGAARNMKKLASAGKGNYLHIKTYSDAKTKLVEEVKLQSKQ